MMPGRARDEHFIRKQTGPDGTQNESKSVCWGPCRKRWFLMLQAFLQDVVDGLRGTPKRVPSKYFYDQRGSELFERICELDEYYLTRTELAIMRCHAGDMADAIGPGCLLIEPGSGNSRKVRLLLEYMREPAGYVPVDISAQHMTRCAALLGSDFPDLHIAPVAADFCEDFEVPEAPGTQRRVVYFPGSTIGNFTPEDATAWLSRMARVTGRGGGLLIGVDLKKDIGILEAAYNDSEGVTRDFNLNLLSRLKRDLGADVRPERFEHRAFYNKPKGRIEMHLVSAEHQTIRLDHTEVELKRGETIHTENSYKFDLDQFRAIAEEAGWRRVAYWMDDEEFFSVQYFEVGA